MKATLAGGPPYTAEFRTVLPDGRIRWISNRGRLIRDPQGQPSRMVGASMDVTERVELLQAERRARDEAEAARRRLELLAKAGAVLSGSLDPDETLHAIASIVVPAVADWCRIDLLDETGALKRRLAHHSDPQRAERALQMAREMRAAPGSKASMAWVMTNAHAHRGSFQDPDVMADPAIRLYTETFGMREHYFVPLVARGRTIGAMAVVQAESGRDLTEEDQALVRELAQRAAMALDNARLYAEAEATRRHAESANRAKDEFLAILGHELRNPLAPIASALELMALRNPAASVDERRVIGRQVAHLSRLIDDLLDVSRITQGKIQLRWDPVDMKAVVANAVELTRPMFDKHTKPVELRLARAAGRGRGRCRAPDPGPVQSPGQRGQVHAPRWPRHAGFGPGGWRSSKPVCRTTAAASRRSCCPGCSTCSCRESSPWIARPEASAWACPSCARLRKCTEAAFPPPVMGPEKAAVSSCACPPATSRLLEQTHGEPAETPADGSGRILVVDDNADAAETLAEILRLVGYEVRCAGHGDAAMALLDSYVPAAGLAGHRLAGHRRLPARGAAARRPARRRG